MRFALALAAVCFLVPIGAALDVKPILIGYLVGWISCYLIGLPPNPLERE